jgi:hypothetical protein
MLTRSASIILILCGVWLDLASLTSLLALPKVPHVFEMYEAMCGAALIALGGVLWVKQSL